MCKGEASLQARTDAWPTKLIPVLTARINKPIAWVTFFPW